MDFHLIRFCLILLTSVLCLAKLAADDLRTWTDSTGKFTLEAKFIGIEGGKVVLEKADGSRVQIELSKLKFEDRTEAMKLNAKRMTENPFKSESDNPFKNTTKNNTSSRNSKKTTEPDPHAPAPTSIEWTSVKQLSVFGSDWKAPSISTADQKLSWQPRPVVVPSKDFWDKTTGIVVSPSTRRAVVVSSLDKPGNQGGATSTVHVCDLEKGTILKSYPVTGKFTPLALSPDATQVIARQDIFGHNNSHTLELWKVNEAELIRQHRWVAAQDDNSHGRDVHGAAFLGDGKTFLTWLSGGQLTWWNSADLKPVQSIALQGNCTPTLTPDQKLILAKSNNDLVVLDAATGDTLSVKPLPGGMHHRFVVSPDGKRIAALAINKVEFYDAENLNLITAISMSGFGPDTPLHWTSPTAVLAGQPLCYLAPEMNVNAWAYDGVEKFIPLGDYVLLLAGGTGQRGSTIVPARLPHNAALQMMEQAKSDPRFFILKPGATVSIDASGIRDLSIQQEVIQELTKKLQAQGFTVGSSNITLQASMEKSKDHEVSYHTFGSVFGRGQTHTVPGWTYQLKLIAEGRTHWHLTGGNHPPPLIHLKRDETIESHLKQYGVPSASFFKHLEVPKYVARSQTDQAGASQSLRRSQVTSNGIR